MEKHHDPAAGGHEAGPLSEGSDRRFQYPLFAFYGPPGADRGAGEAEGASTPGKGVRERGQPELSDYFDDALGRMTGEQRTINGASKSLSYDYNLDGSLWKLHYPSGAVVTYTPDSAGRTISALDSVNNINYATAATFQADGQMTGFTSGHSATFAGITNSFTYNTRLQPINMSAASPSQTVFSIGYDFHWQNSDNGNVFAITNFRDINRNQTFAYDSLNRLTSAQNAGTDCGRTVIGGDLAYWGNNYTYDAWGNLTNKTKISTACAGESLGVTVLADNRIANAGYAYDSAGNMTLDGTDAVSATYDEENRIATASKGGVTTAYIYDADGNRVEKSDGSTGTLYWYMTPGIVAESDLTGALKSEYVFFNGERVARRDFGPTGPTGVFYYFSDHLKTASVITDAAGNIKSDSDYYPWGGELQFVANDPNHYKFTGKERDSETGLDYFGARYYSNGLGRFITPDWAAKAAAVPYADFADPQSLNLYTYVRNIPTSRTDPTGHYELNASGCSGKGAAKCQKKYNKVADRFEKARQKNLQSKDPRVKAAAAAYGAKGTKNGVHVGFKKLSGQGIKGEVDPSNSGKGRPIDIEVTLDSDLSGKSLEETIAHEGTHVADDMNFLTSYDFASGKYNQSLNPYHLQTEFNAYSAGSAVTQEHGFGPNEGLKITNFIYAQPAYQNILFQPIFPNNAQFPQAQGPPEEQ